MLLKTSCELIDWPIYKTRIASLILLVNCFPGQFLRAAFKQVPYFKRIQMESAAYKTEESELLIVDDNQSCLCLLYADATQLKIKNIKSYMRVSCALEKS